jgi:hypothetical protein
MPLRHTGVLMAEVRGYHGKGSTGRGRSVAWVQLGFGWTKTGQTGFHILRWCYLWNT